MRRFAAAGIGLQVVLALLSRSAKGGVTKVLVMIFSGSSHHAYSSLTGHWLRYSKSFAGICVFPLALARNVIEYLRDLDLDRDVLNKPKMSRERKDA